MKENAKHHGLQSAWRIIQILNLFRPRELDHPGAVRLIELSPTDISQRTGIPRVTVYRYLQILSNEGLLRKDSRTGLYSIGLQIIELAGALLRNLDVRVVARPYLLRLADDTGETVDLDLLRKDDLITVEQIPGKHILNPASTFLTPLPLHCTSTGKVFLAFLDPPDRDRILAKPLKRYTPHTITDPIQLLLQLEEVPRLGYAIARGELDPDVTAIGAPIWDATGRVIAAFSVAGPTARIDDAKLSELVVQVKATSRDISAALGYART